MDTRVTQGRIIPYHLTLQLMPRLVPFPYHNHVHPVNRTPSAMHTLWEIMKRLCLLNQYVTSGSALMIGSDSTFMNLSTVTVHNRHVKLKAI